MNITLPEIITSRYKSPLQIIRVTSELWMTREMYCPSCVNVSLYHLPNNSKLADFKCESCGEIYELKSKRGSIGRTILDGAYYAAIERITSSENPNLFVMMYRENLVEALTVVPKYFFTPDVLKMRPPLSPTARRAGYVGSWIMYSEIPEVEKNPGNRGSFGTGQRLGAEGLRTGCEAESRKYEFAGLAYGHGEIFSLDDIYAFTDELRQKHPENHNVEAKIRQQLQYLRDKGFIEFLGNGRYRKIRRG